MQQSRRSGGGGGWIGWLIFVLVIFGSRFLPPVATWLSQVTGLNITTPILIAAIIGLSVVVNIISSVVQEANKDQPEGDSRLPTGQPPAPMRRMDMKQNNYPTISSSQLPPARLPPPPIPPSSPYSGLPQARLPSGESPRLKPPQFEPIIDPRVFALGIVGLIFFGGVFFAIIIIGQALP